CSAARAQQTAKLAEDPWSFLENHRRIRWSRWSREFVIRPADHVDATVDRCSAAANQMSAAREYPCRADAAIVSTCAEDDDAPIAGQRDRGCRLPNSAGANQPLVLSPLTAAMGKHQCHASLFGKPAHNGDVAVGG